MTLFCFIGIIVTAATVVLYGEAIWDPVELVSSDGIADRCRGLDAGVA